MSNESNIEWTDATWNPVVGCTKVSEGCRNCYAMGEARRVAVVAGMRDDPTVVQRAYADVVKRDAAGVPLPQWNNEVRCIDERLDEPLRWKKPRRIFVNSMSDLFHKSVPFDFIDKVFAVMSATDTQLPLPADVRRAKDWHTYQVLTKRPDRMAEYMLSRRGPFPPGEHPLFKVRGEVFRGHGVDLMNAAACLQWPPPNVWLGTSCENQEAADERIPHLLRCPAAVRFLSCEPLLGPIDDLFDEACAWACPECGSRDVDPHGGLGGDDVTTWVCDRCEQMGSGEDAEWKSCLDWVIVGGESGAKARPCNVEWIRSIVQQCKGAGVPCFVKQLGSRPEVRHPSDPREVPFYRDGGFLPPWAPEWAAAWINKFDRKGGDPSEWPEDLRVREWPNAGGAA